MSESDETKECPRCKGSGRVPKPLKESKESQKRRAAKRKKWNHESRTWAGRNNQTYTSKELEIALDKRLTVKNAAFKLGRTNDAIASVRKKHRKLGGD